MTDVYIVIIEDRHADTDVEPFSSEELAILRAGELAASYMRDPVEPDDIEYGLNEAMVRDGWVWYCRYSCEGDSVRVLRREMDKWPA
jgi:hypothetical protein